MRECIIRGDRISDWDALYDQLSDDLALPEWFGRNLDALFDCLTEMDDTVYIAMDPVPTEESKEWFQRIYEVISDAAAENENIIVLCRADDIEAVL